jgi:hypothetical protein
MKEIDEKNKINYNHVFFFFNLLHSKCNNLGRGGFEPPNHMERLSKSTRLTTPQSAPIMPMEGLEPTRQSRRF